MTLEDLIKWGSIGSSDVRMNFYLLGILCFCVGYGLGLIR
jgi:hypothetical protein